LSTRRNKPLRTEVLTSAGEFAVLEEEWEELYHDSPRATPFQSWAWLYSWWEFYGEGYELRLVTVRDEEGLLIGLAPLMLERRLGLSRLLFVGTGPTDYLDVLAREGWETQVSEALVRTLRQMGSWQVADLQELRPEAAAWGLFEHWSGLRISVWQSNCPVVDAKPWDELLASIKKSLRSSARQTLRRARDDGLRCELAGVEDAKAAARRLVTVSRQQWQSRWRETGPEHWTSRFEAHLEVAGRRVTARGLGAISEFWRDGEVVVSHFLVFGRDFVGAYLQGASQEALQRYQSSSLYIWDAMDVALSRNSKRLDLLRGEEPYKLRWSSGVVPNHRIILGRDPLSWAPYAGYYALRSKARRYVSSEDAPGWAKDATSRYKALRYAAAQLTNKDKRS
jgi:CelD/BcsL family acetyltransferase involved in cellulose biosynthesis